MPSSSLKPGLLGIPSSIPSLNPSRPYSTLLSDLSQDTPDKSEKETAKQNLYQQLSAIEQLFITKTPVHISQLLSLFSEKQVRFDTVTVCENYQIHLMFLAGITIVATPRITSLRITTRMQEPPQ